MDAHPVHVDRIHRMEMKEIGSREGIISSRVAVFFKALRESLENLPEIDALMPLKRSVDDFLYRAGWLPIEKNLTAAGTLFSDLDGPAGYEKAVAALHDMESLIAKCEGIDSAGRKGLKAMSLWGRTAEQILGTLAEGMLGHGSKGYSLFSETVSLYGPGMLPPLEGGLGHLPDAGRLDLEQLLPDHRKEPKDRVSGRGKIKIRTDIPFPLRYRELVGDYFRSVAEDYSAGH
jgi:hypothetical protein